MTSEETVFVRALDQGSTSDRRVYLDQACAGNAELRRRVESLLLAHERAAGILEVPPAGLDTTLGAGFRSDGVGSTVGPYRLLEQIGGGGMGVVYMAEQLHPIRRKVALKIIKPGMDSGQVIARFEAERQALTMMDHLNIAKVLDAGATDGGRPYFVMELVKGIPITEYCDQSRLDTRQRLELFVQVCHAVQHAHQKGIIHRDLKPTNVLVTLHDDKPVPKVIDFGIAKATGQALTERTLFTNYAQMLGTPLYMSPEQAQISGLDVDTRSDVYSLGVLLYELLTGTTPFDKQRLCEAAHDEMRRIIREEDPPKPSTRLSDSGAALASISAQRQMEPAKLTKLMRGELDWIVMKTLEKDRGRRYETASAFAADVQRYLNDEAVHACPPSATYRFGKFARRNKRALAGASVLALAVLVVAGTLGWAVRDREAHALEAAKERAARKAAVEHEVNLALKEADRLQEQGKWPEALSAAKRAEGLLAGGGGDEFRERAHQLRRDLEMVLRLEEIRLLSSEWKDDKFDNETAARAYAQAFVDYGIDVSGLPPEEAAARIRGRAGVAVPLAAALDDWAFSRSMKDEAGGLALTALAQSADPDPWRRQVRQAVQQKDTKALAALAASPELLRQPPASLRVLARALRARGLTDAQVEVLRQAQRQYPGDFWINYQLARPLGAMEPPHRDEAVSFLRAALAARPKSIAVHNDLGAALTRQGKLDEAVAVYRKAIDLDAKFVRARVNLGIALMGQKKPDEAIAAYRRAIELDPKFANAHYNLGNALRSQGKLDDAIACYRRAIDLDPEFAAAHDHLGNALNSQGKLDEAIASHRKAIEHDPNHPNAHFNLGNELNSQGKLDEAITSYRRAVELDPKFANAHSALGLALKAHGKLDDAIAAYRKAIKLDPKLALAHYNLGRALAVQEKVDEAIAAYKQAVEIDPKLDNAHYSLAWVLTVCSELKLRDPKQALVSARRAVELDPKNGTYWQGLGYAEYRSGNWKAAVLAFQKVEELGSSGDSVEWFPLSMCYWQLRDKDVARKQYDKAVQWMEKHGPKDEFLRGLRAEAAELMGIELKKE